jgi:hypothetical protein
MQQSITSHQKQISTYSLEKDYKFTQYSSTSVLRSRLPTGVVHYPKRPTSAQKQHYFIVKRY